MGKASSSKKVARAAGTGGGRTARARTPWSYFSVLAVIVVLGLVITWTSRSRYENQQAAATNANATVQPTVGTTWYEGYGVDVCGTFQKPIDKPTTASGISTAGNGVITIAPKKKKYAGKNATLGVFASSVGLTLGPNQIGLPGGKTYVNGDTCHGTAAKLYVKEYAFVGATSGVLETKIDPTSLPLNNDALITLAFVPASQKGSIPAPPASVQHALTKITTPSTTTTTTVPSTSSTTTTKSSSSTSKSTSSSTTVGSSSSTTAKSSSKASSTGSAKSGSKSTSSGTTSTTTKHAP